MVYKHPFVQGSQLRQKFRGTSQSHLFAMVLVPTRFNQGCQKQSAHFTETGGTAESQNPQQNGRNKNQWFYRYHARSAFS